MARPDSRPDTVFVAGNIHSGWACGIPADPANYPATGNSVAEELVRTSVTSDNLADILNVPPLPGSVGVEDAFTAANPHVKVPGLRFARLFRSRRNTR
ncbi:alkaline phosphatase D family protein [Arthrobacter sp. UYCu712]|uniref:alkaline phosphatase D family protein n=1 Tax=Arthrobacter sp. UYCu712 TaxID=3156340 RepID=UPI003395BC58